MCLLDCFAYSTILISATSYNLFSILDYVHPFHGAGINVTIMGSGILWWWSHWWTITYWGQDHEIYYPSVAEMHSELWKSKYCGMINQWYLEINGKSIGWIQFSQISPPRNGCFVVTDQHVATLSMIITSVYIILKISMKYAFFIIQIPYANYTKYH